jgi:hypothetical protein
MMKYLTVRWKNTFEGRSITDGFRLLFKPAAKPTIVEGDGAVQEDDKNKNKKVK